MENMFLFVCFWCLSLSFSSYGTICHFYLQLGKSFLVFIVRLELENKMCEKNHMRMMKWTGAGVESVLVRVLQRNRASRMCTFKEIYYKELVHRIKEADRSQDLQRGVASWRHRRTSRVVPIWRLVNLRPGNCPCFSLSPKTGRSQCPSSKVIRQEECCLTWGRPSLLFYSYLQLIE